MSIEMGSYVVHAKLPELGAGEVLSSEKGALRIRFASGERSFSLDFVSQHLTVTSEAPAKPPAVKAKSRAKKAARAAG